VIGKNLKTVLKLWPLYLFLIGYFSFALFTFKDFGISKDEPNYYRQGTILKEYFLGHRLPQNIENSEDNPLLNQTYLVYEAFLSLLNPTGSYEIYHLLNLLFSSLIFIFAYVVLYQKYKDAKLALLGPLFIFFSGRFLGLIPFDPPNVTFAVMFFVSLCLLYLTDHFRNKFFNSIFFKGILLGIMFGLTIALNFMGIILYLLYLLQVFYNLFYSFKETQNSSKIKYLKYAGLQFLIVLFTGTFLMIATWPYLGSNPLAHFSELFVKYINPMGYGNLTYYLGQLQSSLILPWHYLFVWLGLTLPIVILVLYLVSLVFSFKKFSDDLFFLNFFAILIAFIIYFAIKFPNIQGLGPFLFLVPLICLQAALVIVETLYQAKNVLYKQVLITIFALSFATVAFNLYKLHPYEYLYFNELSGDLRSASRNFEIDYLQTTNKEVSQKIIDDIIHNNLENPQVYACGEKEALKYFGRGIYTITEKTSEADYLVCPANQFELEPTFQLVKEGVILNNITKIHHQY
jgi:hypothetical protein